MQTSHSNPYVKGCCAIYGLDSNVCALVYGSHFEDARVLEKVLKDSKICGVDSDLF